MTRSSKRKSNTLGENTIEEGRSFALPETHQLLRDSVRRFAEAEIAPIPRRRECGLIAHAANEYSEWRETRR